MLLDKTNVVLGVTGSISAYKAAYLTRQLQKKGAQVQVVMTAAATEFITPLTFNTLSNRNVYTGMFEGDNAGTRHIDLGKWADVILVAPATANIIAKVARGIADDLLSAILLAFAERKIMFAPAMNVNMYNNPVTRENIEYLKGIGYYFVEPDSGELACGDEGAGRLPEISTITEHLHRYLHSGKLLNGKRVVITAGPTREFLDQVRYISNRSSGKMGYALANEAAKEGASVTLISGPTTLKPPSGVETINVESAQEMQQELRQHANKIDYLFMAAAVEDIAPAQQDSKKLKKEFINDNLSIKVNPDIVQDFRDKDQEVCIIGFSLEMEKGLKRSKEKMRQKGLDYIVWNDPEQEGAGFEVDTNEVVLIAKNEETYKFQKAPKRKIAEQIINRVVMHNE
ncbi:MAG: bifunctional phosphopantothenoylcysteine decarboxylase/phosphopantothenate--cysteine ligase CoaBC [Candidatus Marinimicrobia bacterium]|nr:bifunctional phosphopantothenoylcysteine decarboxylase/phosphopantothenate--cysteine ligase CoaBC [Candidatus Neomarinimicrobiota bacterium]